jgi:arylamine N-acetyltransferase
LVLEVKHGDAWEHKYRILQQPVLDIDCEVSNWFTGTHPSLPFVSCLIVARPGPGGARTTFFNGRLSIRRPPDHAERSIIDDAASYRAVLAEHFSLELDAAEAEAVLQALDRAGTRGMGHPAFA